MYSFICLFRDGIRESGVVTKIFEVQIVDSDHSPTEENENRFIYELQQEKKVDLYNAENLIKYKNVT
jgi:hypothetical protein